MSLVLSCRNLIMQNNNAFRQIFFSLLLCTGMLTGCASTQGNNINNEHYGQNETEQWLVNLTQFVELSLKNHPSLQYQPVEQLELIAKLGILVHGLINDSGPS